MKQSFVICDIDGTLSDCSERRNLCMKDGSINWDCFFDPENIKKDKQVDAVAAVVKQMILSKHTVLFLTGREEKWREPTRDFIYEAVGETVGGAILYMRKDGDYRSDVEVKKELFDMALSQWRITKEDILFVLDDRNSVVKMWREMGLTCFQVAEGDF